MPFGQGYLESRLVMRPSKENHNDHLSLYISSHSGCRMGCEMCHLTHTNQTSFLPANQKLFFDQLSKLLFHYKERLSKHNLRKAQWVYLNFMARGEPLLNPSIQEELPQLYSQWKDLCAEYDLSLRINISTIMPKGIKRFTPLKQMFSDIPVHLYYSLYSLDPKFREIWLPKAMDPYQALDLLKTWEVDSNIPVTFHWPLIAGHNDSKECIENIADHIKARGFKGRYHLVRFNTPNDKYKEASQETMNFALSCLASAFPEPSKSKCIQRVGEDVHASCGTFWAPSTD